MLWVESAQLGLLIRGSAVKKSDPESAVQNTPFLEKKKCVKSSDFCIILNCVSLLKSLCDYHGQVCVILSKLIKGVLR